MASPTAVQPPTFDMTVGEVHSLDFDCNPYLAPGETIEGVSVEMTDTTDGSAVVLSNALHVHADTGHVTQTMDGPSDLESNHVYRVRITFTAGPSDEVWQMDLEVTVWP